MQRRPFLRHLGALVAAAAGLPGVARAASRSRRIVVVGAGIVGASIAYRLARRGARVTLVDRTGPAAGATARSFAWLNADFSKRPQHYHELNRLGLWSYRLLQEALPDLAVQWGGALRWAVEAGAAREMREQVRQQQEWGYPVRLIEVRELQSLETALRVDGLLAATWAEPEGCVDPVATTRRLVAAATAAGADLMMPSEVTALEVRGGRIAAVRTAHGDVTADIVVLAAGVRTPALAAMAGAEVPLVPAPGLLVHTRPMPPLLRRVAIGPAAHIKQYRDGRVVIGDDLGPPRSPAHGILAGEPDDFPDDATRRLHARRLLAEAALYLPPVAEAPVDRVTVGWRPMPRDGYPIVGACAACPNLYVAVTHSGVTLASILGEFAATELLDEVHVQALAPYRLARFAAA